MTIPLGDREHHVNKPTPGSDRQEPSGVPETGEDPLGKIGALIGGKFRIRSHVKGGGFAEVYQGFNVHLPDQRVIIKFLRDQTLADRFEKEAQLLCRLDHPNICRVIDYLHEEHAIIVPFIDGKDCDRVIRSSGPLPADVFLKVALTITDALAFAHARKIAHRDIKPGNIIIDRHGVPYLIDFGIAKEIDVDSTSTRTGYIALTPQFAAPERQSGEVGYNPFLSDIYELGVTLCVLATGELPYRNAAYPSLRDWDRSFQRPLPPSLRRVLQHAAHPTPTERVQSAAELATMLRQVEMVEPRSHSRAVWLSSSAIGIILVGLAIWQFGTWSDQSPSSSLSTTDALSSDVSRVPQASGSTAPNDAPVVTPQEDARTGVAPPQEAPATNAAPTQVQPEVRLDAIPHEGSVCFVDGVRQPLGREHGMAEGIHRVRIVHPQFPILERSIRIAGRDTALVYDLAQEFAGRDTVDLRIMLNPPSTDYELSVVMNGSTRTFASFPTRELWRMAGRWRIELRLVGRGDAAVSQARVDSTVTFPYGGGPRVVLRGASGDLDFGGDAWQGKKSISFQVNWSVIPTR